MNIELSKQELIRVIYCVDRWLQHLDNSSIDRHEYEDLPPLLEKLDMRYRMDDSEYNLNTLARKMWNNGEMDEIKEQWKKQGRL